MAGKKCATDKCRDHYPSWISNPRTKGILSPAELVEVESFKRFRCQKSREDEKGSGEEKKIHDGMNNEENVVILYGSSFPR